MVTHNTNHHLVGDIQPCEGSEAAGCLRDVRGPSCTSAAEHVRVHAEEADEGPGAQLRVYVWRIRAKLPGTTSCGRVPALEAPVAQSCMQTTARGG